VAARRLLTDEEVLFTVYLYKYINTNYKRQKFAMTRNIKYKKISKITISYSEMTSARDLDIFESPAKKPLLDNVAMTVKASPHTATPLSEIT
jgi:hypothetical protein